MPRFKSIFGTVISVCISLLANSCATTEPLNSRVFGWNEIHQLIREIRVGIDTREGVERKLGKPYRVKLDHTGETVLSYRTEDPPYLKHEWNPKGIRGITLIFDRSGKYDGCGVFSVGPGNQVRIHGQP